MTDWILHRAAQAAEQFAAQAWDCIDRPISQEWTLALMALRDALAALPGDPITTGEPDPLDSARRVASSGPAPAQLVDARPADARPIND